MLTGLSDVIHHAQMDASHDIAAVETWEQFGGKESAVLV